MRRLFAAVAPTRLMIAAALTSVPLLPLLPVRAAVPVVFVDGRGFGHGVGMAQDGAFWMGKDGASTAAILSHFYPGTAIGKAAGSVRVVIHNAAGNEVVLSFPNGGEVRDAPSGAQSEGFPLTVRSGEQVRIRASGGTYSAEVLGGSAAAAPSPRQPADMAAPQDEPTTGAAAASTSQEETTTTTTPTPTLVPTSSSTTTTAPPTTDPPSTTTTAPSSEQPPAPSGRRASSSRPLWSLASGGGSVSLPVRGRQYRGAIEATGAPALRLVNELDVETYLRGMGEVRDPSWPPASLRAQAIAARTYALRATAAGAELCDDQRCQVYLGSQAEYAAMNKAVTDSAGQVITFRRSLVSAVYSANGGGHSASTEEGFGTPSADHPYLRSATYLTQDALRWSTTISLHDVAVRLGYPGEVTDVRVARSGPSGRATEIVLEGTQGPKVVSGLAFDASLGLRSTLFTLRVGTTDTPPPPPGEASLLQLPPDAVASATTAEPAAVPTLPSAPAKDRDRAEGPSDAVGLLTAVAAALSMAVASAWSFQTRRHRPHWWTGLRQRWFGSPES